MNKKITTVLLLLVMVCSLFGLTACDEFDAVYNAASFYYLKDGSTEPLVDRVKVTDFSPTATIYDVLKKADLKYGFDARFETVGAKTSILSIDGKGLEPTKVQDIVVYTDKKPEVTEGVNKRVLNDTTFYEIDFSKTLLEVNRKYMFAVEDDKNILQNKDNFRLEVNLAPAPPVIITEPTFLADDTGEYMFLIRGDELLKLNKQGEILKQVKLNGATYFGACKPITVDNNIVCAVKNSVQVFDIDLAEVWSYNGTNYGEVKSDILYDIAYNYNELTGKVAKSDSLYVAFSSTDTEKGKLVCFNTLDGSVRFEKDLEADIDNDNMLAVGDYLIYKGKTITDEHTILSVDKLSGDLIQEKVLPGEIESKIVYNDDSKSLFFVRSKYKQVIEETTNPEENGNIEGETPDTALNNTAPEEEVTPVEPTPEPETPVEPEIKYELDSSYVCRLWIKETGKFGEYRELKTTYKYASSTPVIYKNRLYVFSGDNLQTVDETGVMQIVNVNTMKEIYSVDTGSNSLGTPLIKVVDNRGKEEIFVIFTLNNSDGGLYYIVDNAVANKAVMKTLFVSPKGHKNSSSSDIILDSENTMYFVNNSNTIFGIHVSI